jgi:6-phosphogluconolactonase
VGNVYIQTNEQDNRFIAFRRKKDGSLTRLGAFPTGGAGDGVPHLTSQGSVVVAGDGRLLVANAASGDVSVFAARADGLELLGRTTAGGAPKSIAEHGRLVYVLNTGDPSLAGFRLGENGLEPLDGSRRDLPAGSDPAQVGFSPDGATLVVTNRGTDSLVAFAVTAEGLLGEPQEIASSGPTPYGFAFAGDTLIVTQAFGAQVGKAAASSYRLSGRSIEPVTRSVGNGRSEICWAVTTPDGRWAFTTNFADGAVSRYAIGGDGSIELEDATAGASRSRAGPACATRTSAPTDDSSTRSTPTRSASSAGRSARAARSRRSARGTASRRRSPAWRRTDVALPRPSSTREVPQMRERARIATSTRLAAGLDG